MIYLKPLGGIGNRMRAIDSTIVLCEQNGQDLTILWTMPQDFYCSFDRLFLRPSSSLIRISVVNVPDDFPEYYLSNYPNLNLIKNKGLRIIDLSIRKVRNRFSKKIVDGKLLSQLASIKAGSFLFNIELERLYNSKKQVSNKGLEVLDLEFFMNVQPLLDNLFSQEAAYISSAYRFIEVQDQYQGFKLVDSIGLKVEEVVRKFDQTVGVHIRRSDHVVSKTFSTTDKFMLRMKDLITKNQETNFFLASDSELVRKQMKEEFGDKIRLTDVMNYKRNAEEGIVGAAIELYCLAQTSSILGSYHSTFSQVAADIGGINLEVIK